MIGNSYHIKTLRGMRRDAYNEDVALQPRPAREFACKLFVLAKKIRGKGCFGKMITDKMAAEIEEFEVIYGLHADDIYKYCLYYLRDVEKASDITREAFLNFFKYYETVDSDAILKCLLYEAKQLLSDNQHQELAGREALECRMKIGKNLSRKKWGKV